MRPRIDRTAIALGLLTILALTPASAAEESGDTADGGPTADGGYVSVDSYTPEPTRIHSFSWEVTPDSSTVEVDVDFGGTTPMTLATDPVGDPAIPAGSDMGLDLTEIVAYIEDGDVPEATFAWRVDKLEGEPTPEAIRHLMRLSTSDGYYSIQAKTSDVVGSRDIGYIQETAARRSPPRFTLHGDCEPEGVVESCSRLDWADGVYDTEADEIRVHVPLDHPDLTGLHPADWSNYIPDYHGRIFSVRAWASVHTSPHEPATSDMASGMEYWGVPSPHVGLFSVRPNGTLWFMGYLDRDDDGVWRGTSADPWWNSYLARMVVRACVSAGVHTMTETPTDCTDLASNYLAMSLGQEVWRGTVYGEG